MLSLIAVILFAGAFWIPRFLEKPPPPPPLPQCERWSATPLVEDGVFYGMFVDPTNLQKLHRLVVGLKNGTCRFPEGTES